MRVGKNIIIAWVRKYIFHIHSPTAMMHGYDYEFDWMKNRKRDAKLMAEALEEGIKGGQRQFMDEFEVLRKTCMAYEEKLRELMGEDEFVSYSTELAINLFAEQIFDMPDCDFKEMTINHFSEITGSDEDFWRLINGIQNDDQDDEGGDEE